MEDQLLFDITEYLFRGCRGNVAQLLEERAVGGERAERP